MNLLENINMFDKQIFDWGEISWLHEPIDSPYKRLSVAQVRIYPKCRQEKHFHLGEEQLFYVTQGEGSFITDGKEEHIKESMIVYIPPYSEHEVSNTGSEDLLLIAAYVPIKTMQLDKPYTVIMDKNIQDLIPVQILKNIQEQLSELLKLRIDIYDNKHNLLTSTDEKDDFCKTCSSLQSCNKQKYESDMSNQLSDKMHRCYYDLIEFEMPIELNENIFGYIKSCSFTLGNPMNAHGKISEIAKIAGMDFEVILNLYKKIPNIIKSRIYVIEEHLGIAAQFIQIMLERSIFDHELLEKDNEILLNTKEKILLKDALKKANDKIFNERIFAGSLNISNEIIYPYDLELILEDAIKVQNKDKIEESINKYKINYNDSEKLVQEMIIVLSRTALRELENLETISNIRKKYNKCCQQIKKEDPWEILKCFCFDCIKEYENRIQHNGRELIDNINIYIKDHYKEDINLSMVADAFFISPNYLSSLFNEKNNVSFSDYVQNLRIEEAKKYLKNTTMKVNNICKNVGYKNNSYFVNIFKKNTGMTPNEYRKKIHASKSIL